MLLIESYNKNIIKFAERFQAFWTHYPSIQELHARALQCNDVLHPQHSQIVWNLVQQYGSSFIDLKEAFKQRDVPTVLAYSTFAQECHLIELWLHLSFDDQVVVFEALTHIALFSDILRIVEPRYNGADKAWGMFVLKMEECGGNLDKLSLNLTSLNMEMLALITEMSSDKIFEDAIMDVIQHEVGLDITKQCVGAFNLPAPMFVLFDHVFTSMGIGSSTNTNAATTTSVPGMDSGANADSKTKPPTDAREKKISLIPENIDDVTVLIQSLMPMMAEAKSRGEKDNALFLKSNEAANQWSIEIRRQAMATQFQSVSPEAVESGSSTAAAAAAAAATTVTGPITGPVTVTSDNMVRRGMFMPGAAPGANGIAGHNTFSGTSAVVSSFALPSTQSNLYLPAHLPTTVPAPESTASHYHAHPHMLHPTHPTHPTHPLPQHINLNPYEVLHRHEPSEFNPYNSTRSSVRTPASVTTPITASTAVSANDASVFAPTSACNHSVSSFAATGPANISEKHLSYQEQIQQLQQQILQLQNQIASCNKTKEDTEKENGTEKTKDIKETTQTNIEKNRSVYLQEKKASVVSNNELLHSAQANAAHSVSQAAPLVYVPLMHSNSKQISTTPQSTTPFIRAPPPYMPTHSHSQPHPLSTSAGFANTFDKIGEPKKIPLVPVGNPVKRAQGFGDVGSIDNLFQGMDIDKLARLGGPGGLGGLGGLVGSGGNDDIAALFKSLTNMAPRQDIKKPKKKKAVLKKKTKTGVKTKVKAKATHAGEQNTSVDVAQLDKEKIPKSESKKELLLLKKSDK